jgi:hypothetical protein
MAGTGVNQAVGRIRPAGSQLAIAGLNVGSSASHSPIGL